MVSIQLAGLQWLLWTIRTFHRVLQIYLRTWIGSIRAFFSFINTNCRSLVFFIVTRPVINVDDAFQLAPDIRKSAISLMCAMICRRHTSLKFQVRGAADAAIAITNWPCLNFLDSHPQEVRGAGGGCSVLPSLAGDQRLGGHHQTASIPMFPLFTFPNLRLDVHGAEGYIVRERDPSRRWLSDNQGEFIEKIASGPNRRWPRGRPGAGFHTSMFIHGFKVQSIEKPMSDTTDLSIRWL